MNSFIRMLLALLKLFLIVWRNSFKAILLGFCIVTFPKPTLIASALYIALKLHNGYKNKGNISSQAKIPTVNTFTDLAAIALLVMHDIYAFIVGMKLAQGTLFNSPILLQMLSITVLIMTLYIIKSPKHVKESIYL